MAELPDSVRLLAETLSPNEHRSVYMSTDHRLRVSCGPDGWDCWIYAHWLGASDVSIQDAIDDAHQRIADLAKRLPADLRAQVAGDSFVADLAARLAEAIRTRDTALAALHEQVEAKDRFYERIELLQARLSELEEPTP